jgi:hypothetical protein
MLADLAILLTSLAILSISAKLFRHASGHPVFQLNMLNYAFHILFISAFVASVIIAIDIPILGYTPDAYNFEGVQTVALAVWAAVMWSFVAIPGGAMIANALKYGKSRMPALSDSFDVRALRIGWGHQESSLLATTAILTFSLLALFFTTLPSELPLLNILAGGSIAESEVLRRNISYGFQNGLLRSMVNEKTLMVLSLISYFMAVRTRRVSWKTLFFIQFVGIVGLSMVRGTAGSLIQYLFTFGIARAVIGKKFATLREGTVVLSVLTLFFIFFKGTTDSFTAPALAVLSRVLFGQIVGTYYGLQVIPAEHDHLGFSSTGRLLNEMILGYSSPDYGFILMELHNPLGVAAGTAGHMSSIFLAEAWVNFGLFGLVLAPVWVGFVVQIANLTFLRSSMSVVNAAIYVTVASSFGYISDFVGFYYPAAIVIFLAGTILLIGFAPFFRRVVSRPYNINSGLARRVQGP